MGTIAECCSEAGSADEWHEVFMNMLPMIRTHAQIAFCKLPPEEREEMVQTVVANACAATARLAELGKLDLAYPSILARYGVARARDGRHLGESLNANELLSRRAQRLKHFSVERLDRFDPEENSWREVLVADGRATPAEMACARIDFSNWLRSLPKRLRQIALRLASGETTGQTARDFGVSPGRISQVRRHLHEHWNAFQGQGPASKRPLVATG